MVDSHAPRWTIIILSMLVVCLSAPGLGAAANASPTPVVPDPAQCTVEPRPRADFELVMTLTPVSLVTMQGSPAPTPAPPTGGVPADAAIQEEIGQTVITIFACTYATDLGRFAALMTDDFFRFFFAGITAENLDRMEDAPPIPEDQRLAIDAVTDVQAYPDGRVSALVHGNGETTLIVFERVGDRWLFDFSYNVPVNGTPTP